MAGPPTNSSCEGDSKTAPIQQAEEASATQETEASTITATEQLEGSQVLESTRGTTEQEHRHDDGDHEEDPPLSEEQTNEALAALQSVQEEAAQDDSKPEPQPQPEASTTTVTGTTTRSNKKRKEAPPLMLPPPQKQQRRSGKNPTRVTWDVRMEMLRSYKQEHGDLLIPIRFRPNPSLGKFVHNTREQYKLYHKQTPEGYKKKCSLTAERIAQLDEIGFVWSTQRTLRQNEDWDARLEQLKVYKAEHGDCLVPHGYSQDPSFAEWVHRQRTTHAMYIKEKEETETTTTAAVVDAEQDEAGGGGGGAPDADKGDKTKKKKRKPEKNNPMVEERMKRLEEMGFNFRVQVDKWSEHFDQLKEYKEKNGHCMVPTHYATNPKMGRWVHTNRHQRRLLLKGRKSSMTQERMEALEGLGFSWEVRPGLMDRHPRATWQGRLEELSDFYKQHGHFCAVGTLHSWTLEQKQRLINLEKRSGKDLTNRMGPERVKALLEIGFTKDVDLGADAAKAFLGSSDYHTADDDDDGDLDESQHHSSNHDDDDVDGGGGGGGGDEAMTNNKKRGDNNNNNNDQDKKAPSQEKKDEPDAMEIETQNEGGKQNNKAAERADKATDDAAAGHNIDDTMEMAQV